MEYEVTEERKAYLDAEDIQYCPLVQEVAKQQAL